MSNYGLYISNNSGIAVNGDTPLLTHVADELSTTITPSGSIFIHDTPSPLYTPNVAPMRAINCDDGYCMPVCNVGTTNKIISSSGSPLHTKLLATSKYNPQPKAAYGMETYNAAGELLFSSYQKYPNVVDIVTVSQTDIINLIKEHIAGSTAPLLVNHAYASKPMYILDGLASWIFTYQQAAYTRTSVGYNYTALGAAQKMGVQSIGHNQMAINPITLLLATSQEFSTAGYQAWFTLNNFLKKFSGDDAFSDTTGTYSDSVFTTVSHDEYTAPDNSYYYNKCLRVFRPYPSSIGIIVVEGV